MIIDLHSYQEQLRTLTKGLQRRKALHVNTAEEISHLKAIAETWFRSLKLELAASGVSSELLADADKYFRAILEGTFSRTKRSVYIESLKNATQALQKVYLDSLSKPAQPPQNRADIEEKLAQLGDEYLSAYKQIRLDLASSRLSYKGPANEVRELLRGILNKLAADEEVKKQVWYKEQARPSTGGPTQYQKSRYILEKKNRNSKSIEQVDGTLSLIEDGTAKIVRSFYSRASVAAHISQDKKEIELLLRHFDALAHDLL